MLTGQLKNQVDKIWNQFATGGLTDALTVIQQATYLLFLRQLDEEERRKESIARATGGAAQGLVYSAEEQPLRWSNFVELGPQQLLQVFTVGVTVTGPDGAPQKLNAFDKMKEVGEAGGAFTKYMDGATFMISNPRLLDQVVRGLNEIEMKDRDTKGDLYEYMLSKIASAGRNGQFRTPRHIIRMMVEMTRPTKTETLCDPSCGTAGFLVATTEYLNEKHEDWFFDETFNDHYHHGMFNGIELDPSMLRIGAMNVQLHGIKQPTLLHRDALSMANEDIRDAYSLILANPPFKGSLDYDAVEPSLLQTTKTKKTELLFLSLMLRMLKTGGRAAVIVPDGVLFGSSKAHKAIRKEIIESHRLEAVISMPGGVFKPYAGVSTAVLFFTKTGTGGTDDVWFYDMQADGLSLDDKRAPVEDNDIPDIIARFHDRKPEHDRKRTDRSFMVPKSEIVENDYDLSINRYKEIVYEEVVYDPPGVIIDRIRELEEERAAGLLELKEMLG